MENFQKTVLFIAIIILIILLIFIGVSLSSSIQNQQWPPIISDCPDYWKNIDASYCENVKNLGIQGTTPNTMNFNVPQFTGTNELCSKYTWATNNNLTWDGITYGVSNPCQTTT
jgi:hypothetical protein